MADERSPLAGPPLGRRVALWLGLMALFVVAAALRWPGEGDWLRTDVRALLPTPAHDAPQVAEAARRLAQPFERETVWLVGHERRSRAVDGARALAQRLSGSGVFSEVEVEVQDGPVESLAQALRPYRHGLIAPADARALAAGPEQFLQRRLASQYSLVGAAGGGLVQDPLGLFRRFLQSGAQAGAGAGDLIGGVAVVSGAARHYGIVTARVEQAAFQARAGPPLLDVWRDALDWGEGERLRVHATGAPLFGAHASANAHAEISLIGGVSLLAIVALLLARFRSPRPLLVTLVVIAAGVTCGLAAAIAVFGPIHLITLVFGATVIGVSVDYAFHYLADSLRPGWTPEAGLRHVLPALRLALATSVLAFLSLALAPFPALREVAVFIAGGLVGAWLTVVLLLPALVRPPPRAPAPRAHGPLHAPRAAFTVAAVILASLPGIALLAPEDDVRLLYSAPDRLSNDDAIVADLLQRPDSNRFLLVSGQSPQRVLLRQERLRPQLEQLRNDDALGGYRMFAQWVPSLRRQRANERRYRELAEQGDYQRYLRRLGFGEERIRAEINAVQEPGPYVRPEAVRSRLDGLRSALWLGCDEGRCAAPVVVGGIDGTGEGEALARIAEGREGVAWVNRIATVNEAMREHRRLSLVLLVVALVIVAAILMAALGARRGLRLAAVPALAVMVSLGAIGYAGALFNVFNMMALLLILGVGIDYALFYDRADAPGRATATLAITMAVTTTVLAFGLLVFSATPVIRAFGVTLLPGLIAAYGLALMLGGSRSADDAGGHEG